MKALVIGYGSIGKRHCRILNEMSLDVGVLSRRGIDYKNSFKEFDDAMSFYPEYIVVCSPTNEHRGNLDRISSAGFSGVVLIEKPVFEKVYNIKYPFDIYVGYNLRFHPVVQRLKQEIEGKKILSVHHYVGQHLSTWRPDTDYKKSYSSSKKRGGGVLRDLSHELDLINFLFGKNVSLSSLGGRVGDVTIDSDDVYGFLLKQENCPVISLQMNYFDRVPRRELIVNTEKIQSRLI